MKPSSPDQLVSVGEVARLTGVSPHTIRVWERRYGRPVAHRLPSGHRRYDREQVRWLERIAEALSAGRRISELVELTGEELDALVQRECSGSVDPTVESLVDRVRRRDSTGIARELRASFDRRPSAEFLDDTVAALVRRIGEGWSAGTISVGQEHQASGAIEEYLRLERAQIEASRGGRQSPRIRLLLATLPGERHTIGIHLAALAATLCGCRVELVGPDLPLEDLVDATTDLAVDAVGISISANSAGSSSAGMIQELRKKLADDVEILIGGASAKRTQRGVAGVRYMPTLARFESWCEEARTRKRADS